MKQNYLALNYLIRIKNKGFECSNLIKKILLQNKPILSICIPTYNRAERLNKSLYSIFDQINNDIRFEIIVSDNRSSDNTQEVVDYYKNRFNNIFYYKNDTNIGMDRNFLEAAKKAK